MVDEPLGEHQLKLHILPPELNGRAFCGDFFLGHKTLELFVVLGLSVTSWMSGLCPGVVPCGGRRGEPLESS